VVFHYIFISATMELKCPVLNQDTCKKIGINYAAIHKVYITRNIKVFFKMIYMEWKWHAKTNQQDICKAYWNIYKDQITVFEVCWLYVWRYVHDIKHLSMELINEILQLIPTQETSLWYNMYYAKAFKINQSILEVKIIRRYNGIISWDICMNLLNLSSIWIWKRCSKTKDNDADKSGKVKCFGPKTWPTYK